MRLFCAVKDGKAIVGSYSEIVFEIFKFKFDEKRTLCAGMSNDNLREFHSYSKDYSFEEMTLDSLKFLFRKLPDYGYQVFEQI